MSYDIHWYNITLFTISLIISIRNDLVADTGGSDNHSRFNPMYYSNRSSSYHISLIGLVLNGGSNFMAIPYIFNREAVISGIILMGALSCFHIYMLVTSTINPNKY